MSEVLLYPPPRSKSETPAVDAVRGFVFTSGISWMKQRGLADAFRELLPARLREHMSSNMLATDWIPLTDALDAYAACDALGLSLPDQIELGRFVAGANNGIVVQTLLRLVGDLASPWVALKNADRLWRRNNRGGAIAVYKTAERQARLEFWRVPLARSPFFVSSMRGAIAGGMEHFAPRVVVTEISDHTTTDGFSLRAVW